MKRVTACHGVGRKPEDGKRLHIIELRLLSPVSRVPCFLLPNEGLTPLAMDMSPTNVGYKFRSPTARKLIAKFPSLMRQREGFHTCRRHVFHAQRQLCFHTAACSGIYIHRHSRCNSLSIATSYRCMSNGTSCLPKELKFATIGILKALETFSQGKEIYCALAIGCTAAYAAVTGRRCAAQ